MSDQRQWLLIGFGAAALAGAAIYLRRGSHVMLSPHFSLAEMTYSATAERLGLDNTPNAEQLGWLSATAQELEKIRTLMGGPVKVTGGFRTREVNSAIHGASSSSDHMTGRAVDINVVGQPSVAAMPAIFYARDTLAIDQALLYRGPTKHHIHLGFFGRRRGEFKVTYDDGRTFSTYRPENVT